MFKMFSYLILPAELALLSGALAPAQSARIEPRSLSFRDAYDLHREADVLRGGGPEYAVVFDRRGLEFTPALGSRAPRNHPFRFTLESIDRGGASILSIDQRGAEPRQHGTTASYQRSPAIVERYDLGPDGVELSFVFRDPLPGSGDLVVRGRIATELTPAATGQFEDGVSFELQGVGGVHVGAVTGIDAAGRRTPGSLRCDGAHLELVLPARFVDTATYPLIHVSEAPHHQRHRRRDQRQNPVDQADRSWVRQP